MRCLRSICGVMCRDQVKNELVQRAGVMRELACREEQCMLRLFGHIERMEEDHWIKSWYTYLPENVTCYPFWCCMTSSHRSKAIATVERVLHPEVYLERVVYDLDYLLETERSHQQLITPSSSFPKYVMHPGSSTMLIFVAVASFVHHTVI